MPFKPPLALAAALLAVFAVPANAGSIAGRSFQVHVGVAAGCMIKTDIAAINFGSVSGASATGPAAQTASPVIICTKTTPYSLHMTTLNRFRMNFGAAHRIAYTVRASLGGKTVRLGRRQVVSNFSFLGTGAPQIVAMAFAIRAWTTTNIPGVYTDTVTMNVDF